MGPAPKPQPQTEPEEDPDAELRPLLAENLVALSLDSASDLADLSASDASAAGAQEASAARAPTAPCEGVSRRRREVGAGPVAARDAVAGSQIVPGGGGRSARR